MNLYSKLSLLPYYPAFRTETSILIHEQPHSFHVFVHEPVRQRTSFLGVVTPKRKPINRIPILITSFCHCIQHFVNNISSNRWQSLEPTKILGIFLHVSNYIHLFSFGENSSKPEHTLFHFVSNLVRHQQVVLNFIKCGHFHGLFLFRVYAMLPIIHFPCLSLHHSHMIITFLTDIPAELSVV